MQITKRNGSITYSEPNVFSEYIQAPQELCNLVLAAGMRDRYEASSFHEINPFWIDAQGTLYFSGNSAEYETPEILSDLKKFIKHLTQQSRTLIDTSNKMSNTKSLHQARLIANDSLKSMGLCVHTNLEMALDPDN